MRIAILALQGAFAEHQQMLQKLGVESALIRNLSDWQEYYNEECQKRKGLIIPGGESTAILKILKDEKLFLPIQESIRHGLPVFGTCAGLIMLDQEHLDTMNIQVKRNAYGRQLGSFHTDADFEGIGNVPMTFIRAPYIESTGEGVEILSVVDDNIVAAKQGNQLVTAFHPELDEDTRIHQFFISFIK